MYMTTLPCFSSDFLGFSWLGRMTLVIDAFVPFRSGMNGLWLISIPLPSPKMDLIRIGAMHSIAIELPCISILIGSLCLPSRLTTWAFFGGQFRLRSQFIDMMNANNFLVAQQTPLRHPSGQSWRFVGTLSFFSP